MPFGPFAKRFSPKKASTRRAASLSALQTLDREARDKELTPDDVGNKIRLDLDGNKIHFDGSEWISGETCFLVYVMVMGSSHMWPHEWFFCFGVGPPPITTQSRITSSHVP